MKEPVKQIEKNSECIYTDILSLDTPVGSFTVSDGTKSIPFSVEKNMFDLPEKVYDRNGTVIGEIHTDTNYTILISTDNLEISKYYTISFSAGKWEHCASDEHTDCFSTVINNWAVGIGGYDFNDSLLELGYDKSQLRVYLLDWLDSYRGFGFTLLDRSREYLFFDVAWVEIKDYKPDDYEGALGFWLT